MSSRCCNCISSGDFFSKMPTVTKRITIPNENKITVAEIANGMLSRN